VATALLFDRDEVDALEDWKERLPRLSGSAVLWIDLDDPDDEEIRALGTDLDLHDETVRSLLDDTHAPGLVDNGEYLQVTAYGPSDPERRRLERIECLVSERWVATIHTEQVEVLETFRERASGSGATGDLDGLQFLANLLEWVLNSYFEAFEAIEQDLEEVDAQAMQGHATDSDDILERLVALRRETGRLRRGLTSHREAFLALTRPELERIASSDSATRFGALRESLESAAQAARDTRDSVVGSFDILIASSGQRTNDIMKILTLASVLILPGSLIAGVLGMNFKLGFFQNEAYFWVALAGMAGIAALTLVLARLRHWI
jgi:magnesium transporter